MYWVRCQIVPQQWISDRILLGSDFLKKVDVLLSRGKVEIVKRTEAEKVKCVEAYELQENDISEIEDVSNEEVELRVVREEYREVVEDIVRLYSPKRPEKSCVQINIALIDVDPVHRTARRLAAKEQKVMAKQIEEWLEEGVVQPSWSDYASPIVLVKKKDDSYRLCVDYRALNAKMIKDRHR